MNPTPNFSLYENHSMKRIVTQRHINENENVVPYVPLPPTKTQIFSLKFARDDDYKYGLSETMRIHRFVLDELPSPITNEVKKWEQTVRLNYTKHATDRMHQYVDRVSDRPWIDGKRYTEMFYEEFEYLQNPTRLQKHLSQSKIVELGLNNRFDICKVSFVLHLDKVCPYLYDKYNEYESRCLFFCVSPGGYLKTINICPGEKLYPSYGGKVKYLDLETVMKIVYR